ncbi:DUF4253 domain-containing protein [Streptomyces verrucosisporus]|uniref:DUF4253 domain-containing protein n=1 Tax=Streptomyces verrucosisporus TaxID=1695161 RepID=UPI0019D02DD3|nr:DUF4253 domain-containing protein [Streptomyces verrucosisporus]MBN3928231.1 DUF4253 domain-containing protein [Streptomyces verrucosisporus]
MTHVTRGPSTKAPNLRSLAASAALPPGTLVDRTVLGRLPEPLLWRADEPAGPDGWERMLPVRDATGLWPVLLGTHVRGTAVEDDLLPPPQDAGGGGGTSAGADTGTAAAGVLAAWWRRHAAWEPGGRGAGGIPALRPYGRRPPELARPSSAGGDPDAAAAGAARALVTRGTLRRPRMALVPAARSADIPAVIGWSGTLASGEDFEGYGTVLRSWEERFGTRVVALEPDVLHLSVPSPPRTAAQALPVAAEHYAFCPSVVRQGAGSISRYADRWLTGRNLWSFWWD